MHILYTGFNCLKEATENKMVQWPGFESTTLSIPTYHSIHQTTSTHEYSEK